MIGVVSKWDDSKGYGFIKTEDGKELFVHYTSIMGEGFKSLKLNQKVEFDMYETIKGLEARQVKACE